LLLLRGDGDPNHFLSWAGDHLHRPPTLLNNLDLLALLLDLEPLRRDHGLSGCIPQNNLLLLELECNVLGLGWS
jgi:hypothetical protein